MTIDKGYVRVVTPFKPDTREKFYQVVCYMPGNSMHNASTHSKGKIYRTKEQAERNCGKYGYVSEIHIEHADGDT